MWQTENGNFESFFSLLLLSLKIWKIRILKRWKTLLGISSFYACVPKTTIIWGTVPEIKSEKEIIFCHFGLFFAPFPYNQPEKSKFWKNEKKKAYRYHHFTLEHHRGQSYDVCFLRYGGWQTELFVFLDYFCFFI